MRNETVRSHINFVAIRFQNSYSARDLKNEFQLYRSAKRKAGDAVDQTARVPVFAEDVLQKFGSAIGDSRVVMHIPLGRDQRTEADDSYHLVQRSQVLAGYSESIECGQTSRLVARFRVKLRADAPHELRATAFRRKHPR